MRCNCTEIDFMSCLFLQVSVMDDRGLLGREGRGSFEVRILFIGSTINTYNEY